MSHEPIVPQRLAKDHPRGKRPRWKQAGVDSMAGAELGLYFRQS